MKNRLDYIEESGKIILHPIGVIHSPISRESDDIPFQPFVSEIRGEIEIFEEFQEGLEGIERFSHITVVYYMHEAEKTKLKTIPLTEDEERGIFGTRSPSRPNHLGISTMRLLKLSSRFLEVQGLDVLDGTPVLDIKPYVPKVDIVKGVDNEWLIRKIEKLKDAEK